MVSESQYDKAQQAYIEQQKQQLLQKSGFQEVPAGQAIGTIGLGGPGTIGGRIGGLLRDPKTIALLLGGYFVSSVTGGLRGRGGELTNEFLVGVGDAYGVKLTDTDIKFRQAMLAYTTPIPTIDDNGNVTGFEFQDKDGTLTDRLLREAGMGESDRAIVKQQWDIQRILNQESARLLSKLGPESRRPGEEPLKATERLFKEAETAREKAETSAANTTQQAAAKREMLSMLTTQFRDETGQLATEESIRMEAIKGNRTAQQILALGQSPSERLVKEFQDNPDIFTAGAERSAKMQQGIIESGTTPEEIQAQKELEQATSKEQELRDMSKKSKEEVAAEKAAQPAATKTPVNPIEQILGAVQPFFQGTRQQINQFEVV